MKKNIDDPAKLVDQDFYKSDQWKAEIAAVTGNDEQKLASLIPAAYTGDKVQDRLDAYANDMARKVSLSYPTHVVAHIIEQDAGNSFKLGSARSNVAKLLKNVAGQGFKLGQTSVEPFFGTHTGVIDNSMTKEELARCQAANQDTASYLSDNSK